MGPDEGWVAYNATLATDTTAQVVKAAPGADKRLVITDLIISNTGSAGLLILQDPTGTPVVLGKIAIGATSASLIIPLRKPIMLGTNKGLNVVGFSSSSVTVVANGFTIDNADIK